jgi:two-component system, response regulator YesN
MKMRKLRRGDAAHKIFLRYALNNILILVLPLVLAGIFYAVSIRAVERGVHTTTVSQLNRSMEDIERLLKDMEQMSLELTNDYDINYYLGSNGPFAGTEYYHLKGISRKIAPWVFGNPILNHAFIYMEKNGVFVFENGFGVYEDVYQSLFSVEGFTAARWRDEILRSPAGERFITDQAITLGGENSTGHIYRRPIGYGGHFLGAIIGVIDRSDLSRMLADVPNKYGGWVFIQDTAGTVLSSTNPDYEQVNQVRTLLPDTESFRYEDENYRIYRIVSGFNGWQYTAILNESRVISGVKQVRNIAFLLLGISFAIGLTIAYLFAYVSSRPIGRLFNLVLDNEDLSDQDAVSAYEQVERAIVLLSDSRKRLEREVRSSEKIVRTYFFQNLLRGHYRTRVEYERDRDLFGIEFASRQYYVVICRLAALNAAIEGGSVSRFRNTFLNSAEQLIDDHDFVVPMSFDDLAVIKSCRDERSVREDAVVFLDTLRNGISAPLRGVFTFGVGVPTDDPYLLIISCEQALSAASSISLSGHSVLEFYGDLPRTHSSYYYPMDVEENIIRAVRSGNQDLLDTLIGTVLRENFQSRNLSGELLHYLFVELHGTVLRLLNDLTTDGDGMRVRLSVWSEKPPGPEKLNEMRSLLREVGDIYDTGKKSHNSALLQAIQQYVQDNYASPSLSLTKIADMFGKSENYVSNFFKEQTGNGLLMAIQRIRFDRAVELLADSDQSIDNVARQCGYNHTDSFRRAFKRMHGLSPSEYRTTVVGREPRNTTRNRVPEDAKE